MASTSAFAQWSNMRNSRGSLVGEPTVIRQQATPSLDLYVLSEEIAQQVINTSVHLKVLEQKYKIAAEEIIGGEFLGFTEIKVAKLNSTGANTCEVDLVLTTEADMGNGKKKIVDVVYITGERAGTGFNFNTVLNFSCEELSSGTKEDGSFLIGNRNVTETRLGMRNELNNFEIHKSEIMDIEAVSPQ